MIERISKSFFKLKPWKHQYEAVNAAAPHEGFGFFFEVGAGKTAPAITMARYQCVRHGRQLKVLILANPPVLLPKWKKEYMAWSNTNPHAIQVLNGTTKERIKLMEQIGDAPGVIITNYESLTLGGARDKKRKTVYHPGELFNLLLAWQPDVLILDESQNCKSHSALRTTQAIKLREKAMYCYLLSGSPILNKSLDIFTQYLLIDKGKTFGTSFFAFRGRYFKDKNAGMSKQKYFPKWEPKEGAVAELNQMVQRKSMYVQKKDCLDLPPLVESTIEVGMSKKQAKAYQEMQRDYLTFIEENREALENNPSLLMDCDYDDMILRFDENDVMPFDFDEVGEKPPGEPAAAPQRSNKSVAIAELAVTKAMRLMQIVSGFVNVEEGDGKRRAVQFEDAPIIQALEDLLKLHCENSKVIVWAVHHANYGVIRNVCDKLKLPYVEVHGGISTQKKKDEAVRRFNDDHDCRVFIGHPGSGGVGIDLIASDVSITFSRSFSLAHKIQSAGRNYRGGSEIHKKVTQYEIVTQKTIDEQVIKSLASKQEIGYQVLKKFTADWQLDY